MGDQERKESLAVMAGVDFGDDEELLRQGLTVGCWEKGGVSTWRVAVQLGLGCDPFSRSPHTSNKVHKSFGVRALPVREETG